MKKKKKNTSLIWSYDTIILNIQIFSKMVYSKEIVCSLCS